MSNRAFFRFDIPFVSFGQTHFWALACFAIFLIIFIVAGLRLSSKQNLLVTRTASALLCLTVIVWTTIHIAYDRFNVVENLPLSICNLFALTSPILFWSPNRARFEIVYFFVLSGTLQAIVTPDVDAGFPSYLFFKYFIIHCGLIVVVLHHLIAFKLYPQAKGIVRAFVWLNIYMLCLVPINLLLNANYFYLMSKPDNPSILDFFGPWPIYIMLGEVVAIAFFSLAYIPIFFAKNNYRKVNTMPSENNPN
ncbi:MAG: YwaF family protein [Sphingomonadales bacterium]